MTYYQQGGRDDGEALVVCLSPCICKTPMGKSTPPIPYMITANLGDDMKTAQKCNFNGNKVFTMDSRITTCTGNEAGTAGGVKSGVNTGHCRPLSHTQKLRVEGAFVIRDGDIFEMNCAGPDGASNVLGKVNFQAKQKPMPEFEIELES